MSLFIDADVAETSIAMLRSGLQGEAVLDGFPDQPFAVELSRLAPEISAAKGTVGIRLTLDTPPTGIRPNMAARVQLFFNPHRKPIRRNPMSDNQNQAPYISLRQVKKGYKIGGQAMPIFDDLNLHIPRGDFVAIMGPSGSGKSTLLNHPCRD